MECVGPLCPSFRPYFAFAQTNVFIGLSFACEHMCSPQLSLHYAWGSEDGRNHGPEKGFGDTFILACALPHSAVNSSTTTCFFFIFSQLPPLVALIPAFLDPAGLPTSVSHSHAYPQMNPPEMQCSAHHAFHLVLST